MNDRTKEKLVELLTDNLPRCGNLPRWDNPLQLSCDEQVQRIADHLIMNGVTVQEWISVTERLPTIYDADADNCVLAIHKASNKRYYHWRSVANNPFDFTHWMKTPQPPKGE